MQFLTAFLAFFYAATAAFAQPLAVNFEVPGVIENEVALPLTLAISGGGLGSGEIENVRTVLFVPGKRSPKFVTNITHTDFTVNEDGTISTSAVYTLPTKKYLLGYSVQVSYSEGEKTWLDSDLTEVKIVDPKSHVALFAVAIVAVVAAFYALEILLYKLAPPGYWERALPSYLHFILPKEKKAKRA